MYYSNGDCDVNLIYPDNKKKERIKTIINDKNWEKCPPIDTWKCSYCGKDLHKEYYIVDVTGTKCNRLLYRLCKDCSDKQMKWLAMGVEDVNSEV